MSKYLCIAGVLLIPFTFLSAESPKKIRRKILNRIFIAENSLTNPYYINEIKTLRVEII